MRDHADLARVLAEHSDDLEGLVRRYVDDPGERDDLRQEIAIACWRALPNFRGHATERTYVLRIARNRAISYCLRLARKRALFQTLPDDLAAPSPDSGEHDIAQVRRSLLAMIHQLPSLQRDVLVLSASGCTPSQIAAQTGRSAGAVRVALHRARRMLRRWMAAASEVGR
ncbi:MAG: RNA polymerase sigma factor [Gemmatimonadales bacterium]|nr:RNA polymerase sigma factor [Gemmatimonadales bacterium]